MVTFLYILGVTWKTIIVYWVMCYVYGYTHAEYINLKLDSLDKIKALSFLHKLFLTIIVFPAMICLMIEMVVKWFMVLLPFSDIIFFLPIFLVSKIKAVGDWIISVGKLNKIVEDYDDGKPEN